MGNETKAAHKDNGIGKPEATFTLGVNQLGLNYAAVTVSKPQ